MLFRSGTGGMLTVAEETLAALATRYRVTPAALKSANSLSAEDITPGSFLVIPAAAQAAPRAMEMGKAGRACWRSARAASVSNAALAMPMLGRQHRHAQLQPSHESEHTQPIKTAIRQSSKGRNPTQQRNSFEGTATGNDHGGPL